MEKFLNEYGVKWVGHGKKPEGQLLKEKLMGDIGNSGLLTPRPKSHLQLQFAQGNRHHNSHAPSRGAQYGDRKRRRAAGVQGQGRNAQI